MISVIIKDVDQDNNISSETQNRKPFIKRLNLLSLLIFLTLAYVGFLLYQAVYLNYNTNQKIASLKKEIKEVEADKKSLQTLIAYYQTPAFQELEARKKLGLKMPGEKAIKVEVAQSPVAKVQEEEHTSDKVTPNYQKWLDFISGNYE